MLFTEAPFLDRFALARKSGFRFVEYLFPYPYKVDELKEQLKLHGLTQVMFNLPSGDWAAGERGIAGLPGRSEEFRAGVKRALEYATALGVTRLNCLAGKRLPQFAEENQWRVLVENVQFAAKALQPYGFTLLVEALNAFDCPGFLLTRTAQVVKLIEEAGMPNVKVQYDVTMHSARKVKSLRLCASTHPKSVISKLLTTRGVISQALASSISRSSSTKLTPPDFTATSVLNTSPSRTPNLL